MNKVILFGNLGAEPELRSLPGGNAVLRLRMATTESYLDASKARQERTEWHTVVVWGKRAEGLAKILSKGSKVLVEGSLHTSSYDKEGVKVYKTEINAANVSLAGSSGSAGNKPTSKSDGFAPQQGGFDDDDIPF